MKELMDQLREKCAVSFLLTVNPHKLYYNTIEEYLIWSEYDFTQDSKKFEQMLSHDTLIELQFYPNTPITFYIIYHYDIRKIFEEALTIFNQDKEVLLPSKNEHSKQGD